MFKRRKEHLALQRELDETKALLEEMSGRCCVYEKALAHFKAECKRLASEKDAAQAKYADELQKRLLLAVQIERLEAKNGEG